MKKSVYIIKQGNNQGNCYLIKNDQCNVLIITGSKINPKTIEKNVSKLISNKCIDLIILTHFSKYRHSNLNYFKKEYNSKIAMHLIDYMMPNENKSLFKKAVNMITPLFYSIQNKQVLMPDLIIDEGYRLKEFGINARVINLSSFEKNSIGILTDDGELFCDNIFINPDNANASSFMVSKLKKLLVDIVYPKEGNPILLN